MHSDARGLAEAASRRIRSMLDKIHPTGNLWVEVGAERPTVISLANDCGADLVIVGSHSPFGLRTTQAHTPPHHFPFEVLTVEVRRSWNPMHWFHYAGAEQRHASRR